MERVRRCLMRCGTAFFALLTWVFSFLIGFTVVYYLTFYIRSLTWQMALSMLCTISFWTSNIIRMVSWIPFLGRNGIANSTLISWGVIHEPLEWLLFNDFSVVLAFVHLYTLFLVVQIFNTMMRIDKSLIEAARALAPCPVIGIGQVAYHLAAMAGPRFSVATTLPVSAPVLERNIQACGPSDQLVKACPSLTLKPITTVQIKG